MTFREYPHRAILSIKINLSVSQCIETPFKKWQRKAFPLGIYQYLRFEEDTGWYICAGNGAKLAKFSYIWEALFNVSLMWSCQGHTGNILIACFTFSTMRYVCHQVDQQARSAVIEFMSAESAENFTRQHNRRMIDLAILSVSRIAWTPSFADSWKPGRPSQDGPGHLRLCALGMTPAQNLHTDGWFWLEVGMQQTWKCYLT